MSDFYSEWLVSNRPSRATKMMIDRWRQAEVDSFLSQDISEFAEEWLRGGVEGEPDLVLCLALYGHSRWLTQGWTQLPITIPYEDQESWRSSGLEPTLGEHQSLQASAMGSFLGPAVRCPVVCGELISKQLDARLCRLDELLAKPLHYYTPEDWDQVIADGYEVDDGEFVEVDVLNEPFVIFGELFCFGWALEKARVVSISEYDEGAGLPSHTLYDALCLVDLNGLHASLEALEPALRRIREYLWSRGYHRINADREPEQFWWRHWKPKASHRQGN